MHEPDFFLNAQGRRLNVSLTQCRKQILGQDDALSAALSQTLLNQEIRSLPQRFEDVCTEPLFAKVLTTNNQLLIQPGRADGSLLLLDRRGLLNKRSF
jgi:hypothetical protein